MRERLLRAPAWVLALVAGTSFAVLWALITRVQGESWTAAIVTGAVLGVFFGGVMGPIQHRQNRGLREVAARSPEGLSKRVRRAAWRGPVPDDVDVRQAAHDVVLAQSAQLERQRIWGPALFLLMAALGIYLAVADDPWWWLSVPVWITAAAAHRVVLLRLRRRAELLRPDALRG
ncbi:hypothetical protein [Blastococcus haudaquaticus]|uniref:Glycosyl-4,4'-diaponeurosporenoate acyltransferase n=1 Tax=Blastococcus haudaquaticus TaxID=1938745 RepID=A0A286GHZ8_9ACTN|nr:hypothetical protein [Blastococcus haudaquaticus]SOD95102.1 hypothetical protein SAMN06272739_1099 [Blastococcus haudaquaticus]